MEDLIVFLENCPNNFSEGVGLCANVLDKFGHTQYVEFYHVMRDIVRSWPHYSGNIDYPIAAPAADYETALECYQNTREMYRYEYGKRRIELAKLIANKLSIRHGRL